MPRTVLEVLCFQQMSLSYVEVCVYVVRVRVIGHLYYEMNPLLETIRYGL